MKLSVGGSYYQHQQSGVKGGQSTAQGSVNGNPKEDHIFELLKGQRLPIS